MVQFSPSGSPSSYPSKPLIQVGIQNDLEHLITQLGGARVQHGEVVDGLPPFFHKKYSVVSSDGWLLVRDRPFVGCDEQGVAHFEHHDKPVLTDRSVVFIPLQPNWSSYVAHSNLSNPWELKHQVYGESGHREYVESLMALTGKEVVLRNPRTQERLVCGTIAGITADPRQNVTLWFSRGNSWVMQPENAVDVLTVTSNSFAVDTLAPLIERSGNILFDNGIFEPADTPLHENQIVSLIDLNNGQIIHPKAVVTEVQESCLLLEDGLVIARGGLIIAPHWLPDPNRRMEGAGKLEFSDGSKVSDADIRNLISWIGNGEAAVLSEGRFLGRGAVVGHHCSSTGQNILWLDNGRFIALPGRAIEINRFREVNETRPAEVLTPQQAAPTVKDRAPTPFELRHPVPSGPPKLEFVRMQREVKLDRWAPPPKPKRESPTQVSIEFPPLGPRDSRYESGNVTAGTPLEPGKRYTVIDSQTGAVLQQAAIFEGIEGSLFKFIAAPRQTSVTLEIAASRIYRECVEAPDFRQQSVSKNKILFGPSSSAAEVCQKLTPGKSYEWRSGPLARVRGTFAGAYAAADGKVIFWLQEGKAVVIEKPLEFYELVEANSQLTPRPSQGKTPTRSSEKIPAAPITLRSAEQLLFGDEEIVTEKIRRPTRVDVDMGRLAVTWNERKKLLTWPAALSGASLAEVGDLVAVCARLAARRSFDELTQWSSQLGVDLDTLVFVTTLVRRPEGTGSSAAEYWRRTDPLIIADFLRSQESLQNDLPDGYRGYRNQLLLIQAVRRLMRTNEIPEFFNDASPAAVFKNFVEAVSQISKSSPDDLAKWRKIVGVSENLAAELESLALQIGTVPVDSSNPDVVIAELKAEIHPAFCAELKYEVEPGLPALRKRAFRGEAAAVIEYVDYLHQRQMDEEIPLMTLLRQEGLPLAVYRSWNENLVAFKLEAARSSELREQDLRRQARAIVRESSTQSIESLTASVALVIEGGTLSTREVLSRFGVDPRVYEYACIRAARELLFSRRLSKLNYINEQEQLGVSRSVLLEEAQINNVVLRRWTKRAESYKKYAAKEEFAEQHTTTERAEAKEYLRNKTLSDIRAVLKEVRERVNGEVSLQEVLSDLGVPRAAYSKMLWRRCYAMGWSERLALLKEIEVQMTGQDNLSLKSVLIANQVSGRAFRIWEGRRKRYEDRAELERERGLAPSKVVKEAADWLRTLNHNSRALLVKNVGVDLAAGNDLVSCITAHGIPSLYAYQRLLRRCHMRTHSAERVAHLRAVDRELAERGNESLETVLQERQIARYTFEKWCARRDKYEKVAGEREVRRRRSEALRFVRALSLEEVRAIRTSVLRDVSRGRRSLSEILERRNLTVEAHRLILMRCAIATSLKDRIKIVETARVMQSGSTGDRATVLERLQVHPEFFATWDENLEQYRTRLAAHQDALSNSPKAQRSAAKRFINRCSVAKQTRIIEAARDFLNGDNRDNLDGCARHVDVPNRFALLYIARREFKSLPLQEKPVLLKAVREETIAGVDADAACVRFGVSRRAFNNFDNMRRFNSVYQGVIRDLRSGDFSFDGAFKNHGISTAAYNKFLYQARRSDAFTIRMQMLHEIEVRKAATGETIGVCLYKAGLCPKLYEEWSADRTERLRGMPRAEELTTDSLRIFGRINARIEAYLTTYGLRPDAFARWACDGHIDSALRYAVRTASPYQALTAGPFGKKWREQQPLSEEQVRTFLTDMREKVRAALSEQRLSPLDYAAWIRSHLCASVANRVHAELEQHGKKPLPTTSAYSVRRDSEISPDNIFVNKVSLAELPLGEKVDYHPLSLHMASTREDLVDHLMCSFYVRSRAWQGVRDFFEEGKRTSFARGFLNSTDEERSSYRNFLNQIRQEMTQVLAESRFLASTLGNGYNRASPQEEGFYDLRARMRASTGLMGETTPFVRSLIAAGKELAAIYMEMLECPANSKGRRRLAQLIAVAGESPVTLREYLEDCRTLHGRWETAAAELARAFNPAFFDVAKEFNGIPFSESLSGCKEGFTEAIEYWDPSKSKFNTYTYTVMRRKIYRMIDDNNRMVTPIERELIAKIRAIQHEYRSSNSGEHLPQRALAEILDIDEEEVQRLVLLMNRRTLSLDRPVGKSGDSTLGEMRADTRSSEEISPQQHEYMEIASEAVRRMYSSGDPAKMRRALILSLRFGLGLFDGHVRGETLTLDETKVFFNVTRERIRQIEAKALHNFQFELRLMGQESIITAFSVGED